MAKEFIIIAGLCGSGKTFLATKLHKETPGSVLIDDVSLLTPSEVLDKVGSCDKIFMTDPMQCDPRRRASFAKKLVELFPEAVISYIFMENYLEACKANIERRNDGRRVDITLKKLHEVYQIPEGYQPLPVWREPPV